MSGEQGGAPVRTPARADRAEGVMARAKKPGGRVRNRRPRRSLGADVTTFFEVGLDVGYASVKRYERDRAVALLFEGADADLMTSDQLRGAAELLVMIAADLTEKRLNIPTEPYIGGGGR